MRIKRLELRAYGPFTDVSLDLSEGQPGLHVVFGKNEAGKSSTLRAIAAWWFGFEHRTDDDFLHKKDRLRVGGVLELASGRELACLRRKGNKDTLLDAAGERSIDPAAFDALFAGLDASLYARHHAIDHAALVEGGEALLEARGEVGASLFGTALGTPRQLALVKALDDEALALFKPRGQNQRINATLVEWKAARDELGERVHSVRDFKDRERALRAAQEDVERLAAAREKDLEEKSALARFLRVAGELREHEECRARLAALADAPALSEDFDARRRGALSELAAHRERLEDVTAERAARRSDADALAVSDAHLAHAAEIEALHKKIGGADQARADKPRQAHLAHMRRNEAERALQSIRPDVALEDVERLRPLLNRKRRIANLAAEAGVLGERARKSDEDHREVSEERAALEAALAALPWSPEDLEPLRAALRDARGAGDVAASRASARSAIAQLELECEREGRRLGRFSGDVEALGALPLPEQSLLEEFERGFGELSTAQRDLARRRAEVRDAQAELAAQLSELLSGGEVPTRAALEAARATRDASWRRVRARYVEGDPDAAGEPPGEGEIPLVATYERAIEAADAVSDHLVRDAERVERRAQLESSLRGVDTKLAALASREAELAEEQGALEARWARAWPEGVRDVGSPREMREWCAQVYALRERLDRLEGVRRDARALEALERGHVEALSRALAAIRPGGAALPRAWGELLSLGERALDEGEATRRRREELEGQLARQGKQLASLELARDRIAEERAAWREAWGAAIEGLGLSPTEHPDVALDTMERLEAMFTSLSEAQTASRRVEGMTNVEAEVLDEVIALAGRLGVEVDPRPGADPGGRAAEIGSRLLDELGRSRAAAATRARLAEELRGLELQLDAAARGVAHAEARLAQLRLEAGVEEDDALAGAAERSTRRRELERQLDTLERHLRAAGDGRSIEELFAAAQGADPDRARASLDGLERRAAERKAEVAEATKRMHDAQRRFEEVDGRSRAAEAAERAASLAARLQPDVERYLEVSIARLILVEEMERYRRAHQTPVLKRASELFPRLTLGAFSGLREDRADDGRAILLGERPDGGSLTVEAMSEGTRDQLYLALRLASLEHERRAEPLPFIVDDVLVTFDDARTHAGLEVLAEFARTTTQVLLFTHHASVAESARAIGAGGGVFVHDLQA